VVDRRSKTRLRRQLEKSITEEKSYVLDLRVHSPTALSGRSVQGVDTAPALVRLARVKGIDVLGVTDFYSSALVDEVRRAATDSGVKIIPGFDIRCSLDQCSDAEFTCLFPEEYSSKDLDLILKKLQVPSEYVGVSSYIVPFEFEQILQLIEDNNGIMIPSRIDKTPSRKSVISKLITKYGFRAFDLAHSDSFEIFEEGWPDLDIQLLSFSNATSLAQVGSRTATVNLLSPTFESIKKLVARAI
jgi:PHP family Zn ribbon phosphoesterase